MGPVSWSSSFFSLPGQVKVVGQVLRPQALPYREGMTVLDAVLGSGGLTTYASGNRAKIIRSEGGKSREIRPTSTSIYGGRP